MPKPGYNPPSWDVGDERGLLALCEWLEWTTVDALFTVSNLWFIEQVENIVLSLQKDHSFAFSENIDSL